MPAVSQAQQRFMGMVYAAKKGKLDNPSPEVAKAAASIKKKDAKDFASTKHKGLPNKVKVKEESDFPKDAPSIKDAKPKKKTNVKYYKGLGYAPTVKEESCGDGKYYCHTDKKCKPIPEGSKVDKNGMLFKDEDLEETTYYKQETKYQKKLADDDKKHKEQDKRMKFGKFYSKAKEARSSLRPGEVKRYDKTLRKWVSNKD